jgi:hypothetical protein
MMRSSGSMGRLGMLGILVLGLGSCAKAVSSFGDDDVTGGSTATGGAGGSLVGGHGGTASGGGGGTGGKGGGSPSCQDQGLTDCGGLCVDLSAEHDHCGQCNHACLPEQSCSALTCHCAGLLVECAGACVDTLTNLAHCGGCGNPCGSLQVCNNGQCAANCGTLTLCGQTCVDTNTNGQHCGGCNIPCDANESCTAGSCQCSGNMCGTCVVQDLGSSAPQTVSGSTATAADALTPSCGSSGGRDQSYTFTASSTGTYGFDTIGSSFDTILHVRSAGCVELACNDDSVGVQSAVQVPLTAGQQVLIVVDGYGSAFGSYTLNVSAPLVCPATALGSTYPQTVSGTTSGALNQYSGTCGGSGAPERSYSFTAPGAGSYTFSTAGSSYDTVLYVRDGTCAGAQLGCNDDTGGLQSQVSVSLGANQIVAIFVDGYSSGSGAYQLAVTGP